MTQQTITQPIQTINVVMPSQNTITTAMQNTTTVSNIFNLTSQLIGTTTGVTVGGSNFQNNATSNVNTGGGYFSHFGIIGANPFKGFGEGNNNPPLENNNNNNPSLLPPLGFEGGLGEDFNPPLGGNIGGLDLNVAALVNALTGANLGINHTERKSNHVKPTEFRETEAEDSNEWLE